MTGEEDTAVRREVKRFLVAARGKRRVEGMAHICCMNSGGLMKGHVLSVTSMLLKLHSFLKAGSRISGE